jgi:hypothetical protein
MPYTTSKAQSGRLINLLIGGVTGASGSETFTIVGEIRDPGLTGQKWDLVEVTNTQSTVKERKASILDPGNFKCEGNRVPTDAGQLVVETAFGSGLPYDFKIQYPINTAVGQTTTGDLYVFSGIVESRDLMNKTEGIAGWNIGIQVVSPPVYTAGS